MGLSRYTRHHSRFYAAAGAGLLAAGVSAWAGFGQPLLLGGDVFFLVFLSLILLVVGEDPQTFARRADTADEGIGVVVLVTVAAIGFFCAAVFEAVNTKHAASAAPLFLAGFGAPLGWLVLHTVMAFHYANLHYFDDPESPADDDRDLEFPGCAEPGPWDFLYFSFVIGMTCQVSDVVVKTTVMRRAVLGHGVVAFLFNAVVIAMAVNAAVSLAS